MTRNGGYLVLVAQGTYKTCPICGFNFRVKPSHFEKRTTCGKECNKKHRSIKNTGEGNPNYGNRKENSPSWKGGERVSNYGYILLFLPEHPMSRPDGYVLEHRVVMAEKLGRDLQRDEHVHHKDGDKRNNSPDNLELISMSDHIRLHNLKNPMPRDKGNGRFVRRVET
jgi:hypothetical protein